MNNLLISSREADIAYLESMNAIELFSDSSYVDFFYEDGDSSIGSTIVNKIRNLVEKIQKFFTDLFSKITSSSLKSKADAAMKNDKALAAKKVEVLDTKKIGIFSKKYKEKIKNAKSMEELNKIMADYNKKKKIGFGVGAAVTVGVDVLCGKVLVPKYKEESVKYVEALKQEMETAKEEFDSISNKYEKAYGKPGSENTKVQDAKSAYEKAARIYHGNEHNETMDKRDLAKKRLHVMSMVISDEMHAAKDCVSSKITTLTGFVKDTWHNISEEDAKLILAAKKLNKSKEEK